MAKIATSTFLNRLKGIYPTNAQNFNPWHIITAVSLCGSNACEEVPHVFNHALSDLEAANASQKERLLLARKMRDAIFKAGLTTGFPRTINSLVALHEVMPEDLRDITYMREVDMSVEEHTHIGEDNFRAVYGSTADSVHKLLESAYPDLAWFSTTIGYGMLYGYTGILTPIETSYTVLSALITSDSPRQIQWHLDGARRNGASLEETKAVRSIAMEVASAAGIQWKNGVPEMPQETSKDDKTPVTFSVASILGLKGRVRFAPHGSTQKPHVILRRVVIAEDDGEGGQSTHVVRFSLFAAKRIEVKPGKEILLSVESDKFNNHPIVIEGDEGDGSEDVDEAPPAPKLKKEPSPPPIAMPPKMRKAWMRTKIEEPTVIAEFIPQRIATRQDMGVQAQPQYITASTQARPTYTSLPIQVEPKHKTIDSQTDPIVIPKVVDTPPTRLPQQNGTNGHPQWKKPPPMAPKNIQQPITVIEDRSPSPMELESPVQTPEFSPTLVPGIIETIVLSPSPAPPLGPPALPPPKPFNTNPPLTVQKVEPFFVKEEPTEAKLFWASPVETKPAKPTPAPPAPKPVPPKKAAAKNPFVSAGYVTDFVAVSANGKEERPVAPPVVSKPAPTAIATPPYAPPYAPSSVDPASKPSPRKRSRFDQPAKSFSVKQEELEASISLSFDPPEPTPLRHPIRERPVAAPTPAVPSVVRTAPPPKAPRAMMAALKKDSRPASPATTAPPPPMSKPATPPPAPKEIAQIANGPSSNPLGIRPSVPQRVTKVTPVGSRSLIPPAVAKKRMVIGPNWGQKQANGSAPTTNGTTPTERPVVVKAEPMEVSLLPPEPMEPPAPVPTPKSKWKRIAGESTAPAMISVKVANPVPVELPKPIAIETPPTPSISLKLSRTNSAVASPVLPAAGGLERISTSNKAGPASVSTPQQPLKAKGAPQSMPPAVVPPAPTDAGVPSKKKKRKKASQQQPSDPVSSRSQVLPPVKTTAGKISPSTSISSVITPIATLNHPLPPKPGTATSSDTSWRAIKREREPSPELFTRRVRRRRDLPWPTIRSSHVSVLNGRGNTAVRRILFSKDGSTVACHCMDETIRIWNVKQRAETSRIDPEVPVVTFSWMDDDGVILALDEDGVLGRWIRRGSVGNNYWEWDPILRAGRERPAGDGQVCLTYMRGRIAVSYPKDGVSTWIWQKGHWSKQRSILRQNVTALSFIEQGAALIGGTQDGVLWRCEVPNGTLRAYAFLRSRINWLDMSPSGDRILAAQVGGFARLVSMRRSDQQGMVEKSYSHRITQSHPGQGLGAFHLNQGEKVMFGSSESCIMVWDQQSAQVFCGLEHDEGEIIEAVAAFEGPNKDGCVVTGTKSGRLAWWSTPMSKSSFDR